MIAKIPREHPEFLPIYIEISLYAKVEYFDAACQVLGHQKPESLELLTPELIDDFARRTYHEIGRIKASRKKIDANAFRLLTYARMLARLFPDKVDYAIDYAYDLLSTMEKLIPQKRISDTPQEIHRFARVSGMSSFVEFLSQYYSEFDEEKGENEESGGEEMDESSPEFAYEIKEYDENGQVTGVLEAITNPFITLVLREIQGLEGMHQGKKKLLKLYEIAIEIFTLHCVCPMLAWEYENKRVILSGDIIASKPKRFRDEVIQNSPTLLQ